MSFPSARTVLLFLALLDSRLTAAFTNYWNLTELGIPRDILIWRFTIWRSKAYLALPRWDEKSDVPFTLLEAPWPETATGYPLHIGAYPIFTGVIPFPYGNHQREGDCSNLQSVTGLDSDSRGRLWVLDAPTLSRRCPPRIVLFDLRKGEKVTETSLQGISPRDLRCLVADPDPSQQLAGRVYISDPGDESIIVYSLARRTWWRLKLSMELNAAAPTTISSVTDMAVSRKSSLMYLAGHRSADLFAVDLEGLRNCEESLFRNNESLRRVAVSLVGTKLGSSSGLIGDFRDGLHYFVITEMASVRWNSRQSLKAENHAVLLQSEAVPAVTDFALDSQKNVWALVNERHPLFTKRKRAGGSSVERRTVRVYKFSPFAF